MVDYNYTLFSGACWLLLGTIVVSVGVLLFVEGYCDYSFDYVGLMLVWDPICCWSIAGDCI